MRPAQTPPDSERTGTLSHSVIHPHAITPPLTRKHHLFRKEQVRPRINPRLHTFSHYRFLLTPFLSSPSISPPNTLPPPLTPFIPLSLCDHGQTLNLSPLSLTYPPPPRPPFIPLSLCDQARLAQERMVKPSTSHPLTPPPLSPPSFLSHCVIRLV